MRRTGFSAASAALLMLAACKSQPHAAPGNSSTLAENSASTGNHASVGYAAAAPAPANVAEETPPKPLPNDKELKKQLPGAWVFSQGRPTGNPEDGLCETDNSIMFDKDGSYGEFAEGGRWEVADGKLVMTATTAYTDSDDGSDGEQPIKPPHVYKWPIVEIDGNMLRVQLPGRLQWMFRCPPWKG